MVISPGVPRGCVLSRIRWLWSRRRVSRSSRWLQWEARRVPCEGLVFQIQIRRPGFWRDRRPGIRKCVLVWYLCRIFPWSDELLHISISEHFEIHELLGEFNNILTMLRQKLMGPLICLHNNLLDFLILHVSLAD